MVGAPSGSAPTTRVAPTSAVQIPASSPPPPTPASTVSSGPPAWSRNSAPVVPAPRMVSGVS